MVDVPALVARAEELSNEWPANESACAAVDPTVYEAGWALLTDALDALREQQAELERHHADFERWEDMAARGAHREMRELAKELLDAYYDACWQGSGNEPLSSKTWHNFTSDWEQADELIPRARNLLATSEEGDAK